MPLFKYEALDAQGVVIKDEIEALSQKEAISRIQNMGYFPTKVQIHGVKKKAPGKAAALTRKGSGRKVKVKLVTQFARQLSTLQDAGLPILRSLRILQEQQRSGSFKKIIRNVGDDIEGGSTLSEALARYPRTFDRLFVSMVAAGEAGGVLDLILARVADFMEKTQKLKSRVKSAMVYPLVVLCAAFGILLLLMKYVIPQFEKVLVEMTGGRRLPQITEVVMSISKWIAYQYGWVILLSIPFGLVLLKRLIKQFKVGRYILDMVKLKIPIVGSLSGKIAVARWTRTLGTLIGAGVPILEAINTSRTTAGNEVYAKMLYNVQNSIRQGESFAAPLKQSRTVDLIVSNMVAVGEETGDLDKMLLKVADNFDEQIDVMVASMMSLLEPIMIIMLGLVVMTIVLSIFLPIIGIVAGLTAGASSGGVSD